MCLLLCEVGADALLGRRREVISAVGLPEIMASLACAVIPVLVACVVGYCVLSVVRAADALERAADALERIADAFEKEDVEERKEA